MIYSPEFWSKEAYRAKVKTVRTRRQHRPRARRRSRRFHSPARAMGRPHGRAAVPAQPPTGYSDKSETWVNTGALLNRLNFALALSSNKIPGTKSDLEAHVSARTPSQIPTKPWRKLWPHFSTVRHRPSKPKQLWKRAWMIRKSCKPRLTIQVKHVNQQLIAGLVLGAPEFQRRCAARLVAPPSGALLNDD